MKRVDIDPSALLALIEDNSASLKELYLNEVYIKVHSNVQRELTPLWIGRQDIRRPERCCWVAEALRNLKDLELNILRVTGLGYDDFEPRRASSSFPAYDLKDPSGLDVSFDQRFVEAVMQMNKIDIEDASVSVPEMISVAHHNTPSVNIPTSELPIDTIPPSAGIGSHRGECGYDVNAFQQHHRNTTSHYKKCMDGYFNNHNQQALQELQRIIAVADRGMEIISNEIDRSHEAEVTGDGNIAIP